MSTPIDPTTGRQTNGRFATGNPGGPGNPNASLTAKLRQVMLECLSEADLALIFKALIEKAKEGNVQAAKMVLHYTVGKPGAAEAPSPNGVFRTVDPSPNGPIGAEVEESELPAPSLNGVFTAVDPSRDGENSQNADNSGPLAGKKLRGRALRRWREAVKRAGMLSAGR